MCVCVCVCVCGVCVCVCCVCVCVCELNSFICDRHHIDPLSITGRFAHFLAAAKNKGVVVEGGGGWGRGGWLHTHREAACSVNFL